MTITIDETGTMGEMEVGGEGGEGDVVVITEVGRIDRHTGTGTVMTEDRCLPDDIYDMDEADRGALHQEVPGMGISHGGTNGPGVIPVQNCADPRHPHNQLL